MKQTHVKPAYYAHIFHELKEIARDFGYNLCMHGSMARDFDLVAIPWIDNPKESIVLIQAFCDYVGGEIMIGHEKFEKLLPGGRKSYVINLNRNICGPDRETYVGDPQWYIDISVTPLIHHNATNP